MKFKETAQYQCNANCFIAFQDEMKTILVHHNGNIISRI